MNKLKFSEFFVYLQDCFCYTVYNFLIREVISFVLFIVTKQILLEVL